MNSHSSSDGSLHTSNHHVGRRLDNGLIRSVLFLASLAVGMIAAALAFTAGLSSDPSSFGALSFGDLIVTFYLADMLVYLAPFFPMGFAALQPEPSTAHAVLALVVGWSVYLGLAVFGVLAKRRRAFLILWIIFVALLITNIAGCQSSQGLNYLFGSFGG